MGDSMVARPATAVRRVIISELARERFRIECLARIVCLRRNLDASLHPMISHRPSVLAHERFVADRENFAGLDLAARFERIERTNLWGAPTSVSGLGSEDRATAGIRETLPGLLQRLGARSLLDAPCGDAGWIGSVKLEVNYTGIDIVPSLIAANIARVARGDVRGRFLVADITRDPLP